MARTAKLLLEFSGDDKPVKNRREHSISQMAARSATVREATSRSLNELKRQGAIGLTRTTLMWLILKL